MDTIVISKPRKNDNSTYVANVYMNAQKEKVVIDLSCAVPLYTKDMSEGTYIFIKCMVSNNIFYDLNEAVIENVKVNCGRWFSHSIEPFLIEEYYSNTLVYDKKHGIIIRLKCATPDAAERIMQYEKKLCDISLHLTSLRFFKQKFILEWYVNDIGLTKTKHIDGNDIEDDNYVENEDELELPMPSDEEITQIRNEYIGLCENYKTELRQKISDTSDLLSTLQQQLADVCSNITDLNDAKVGHKCIFTLCEKIDKVLNLRI